MAGNKRITRTLETWRKHQLVDSPSPRLKEASDSPGLDTGHPPLLSLARLPIIYELWSHTVWTCAAQARRGQAHQFGQSSTRLGSGQSLVTRVARKPTT
ncbi:hypothetical protein RRG08_009770 [Elysia crispata]|uniref:Uncharacterized protein n=1 Tax=Elysia crispata TaxID=231223 RepID=A0AAE0ZR72_9GAST|nr:hypothetical protein RRG08_009770 [Elysia crispata]